MAKRSNRRQKRLRKTKADLVAELEALARRPAKGGSAGDAYFRAVIQNSPTAIFVRDTDSRYLLVNRAYERLRNVSDEKIFGKTPHAVFDRQSADDIVARDREVLRTGRKLQRESVLTLSDGTTRVQSTIVFPFHDPQGHVIGVCGIVTDLAEQKRAEQAVRVSEERLRAAIDSLQEGFALFDADDRLVTFNNQYLRVRPSSQKILEQGGTFEDLIRDHVRIGLIPIPPGGGEDFIRERMEQHRNFKSPIIRRYNDGRWYRINETRMPEGGTVVTLVDITDLKRAEDALRKSEALFRAVVNHSPTKIHIKDVEGRYALINKEAEKLFGVSDEEGRGKTSYDLFSKSVADAFMAHDRAVIDSGKMLEKEEEFTLEDGIHTFLTVKFPIYDLDGVAAVGAIGTDITERKRAEETVRRLAAAIEGLSENFSLYGPDDRLIICNRNFRELNAPIAEATKPGITYEEHLRAMVKHGLVPQAVGREEAWTKDRLERHRNPGPPFEVARQDGRWLLVHEQRVAGGSTATIATDITERKRAEETVRRLATAIEGLSENFSLYGPDDRLIMGNRNYREINAPIADATQPGVTFEAHTRATVAHGLVPHAKGREEEWVRERVARHRNPGPPFEVERQDGRWFLVREQRMADGSTATIATDITERKRAEQELEHQKMLFEAVFRDVPDAMVLADTDRKVMMCNPSITRTFGYEPRELLGKNTGILYATREEYERQGKLRFNPDAEFKRDPYVVSYRRKSGELFPGETVGTPIRDRDGNTLGFIAVIRDVTERQKAEEALRESEARLANILDNSPTPIYFKDPQGRFLIANRQYEKMYRVKFSDIRGKTSKQIFGGVLGEQFYEHDQRVLKSRKMIEREEQIFGRSYLTLKFPIVDQTGELLGLGGIETDVTAIKRAEKNLRDAKEHAEFASRAKTEFLANMSHELRTPLNSILGLSEMLMNQTLGPLGSPRYREYAEDIHTSGNHLLGLISEVLDLSKIEAGELEIVESEIDVTDAVSTCVRMIEGRSPEEAPRVSSEFANGLPRLLGDERRFKQILLNLLGNAVKFTPHDGKVSVAARVCDGDRFTIEVADTGIGIAAEDIPKVLEPFGQVRDVFTRNHEGTGLGLYLAKSFTEMHGGTMDIASCLGKGTTVTLRFPKERTVTRR